jgi:predicted MFS family arabinose efflux permease
MGRLLIIGGLVMVAVGLALVSGVPLGRLPGDFWFRRGAITFYIPLTTSLVVSIALTLLLTLLRR